MSYKSLDNNQNPYLDVDETQIWKKAVATKSPFDITELWTPKFSINERDTFSTYGSCFAQHFSKSLVRKGLTWINAEPAPEIMTPEHCQEYGYNVYSSRTQNIYTPTMLHQWLTMSQNTTLFNDEYWTHEGRFFDPLRPTVEPNGFESLDEAKQSRKATLKSLKQSIKDASVFVFTLGLTERWINSTTQMEYSICPGTAVGEYDERLHVFDNLGFDQIRDSLEQSIAILEQINPQIKILLTVSPVPLIATYQKKHVLVSTIAAKSTLRAAAEVVAQTNEHVDYFPSFEIISAFPFKGMFYEPNARNVNPQGVAFVMKQFYAGAQIKTPERDDNSAIDFEAQCEEELLGAFT